MPTGALSELLIALVEAPALIRKAQAWVEYESDPKMPGRIAWRISGPSKEVVAAAIDSRMAEVDSYGGYGSFIGPYRDGDGYLALGETIRRNAAQAAE